LAKITSVSPLAPARFPDLPAIGGARFATTAAGVKYVGRSDVMLALLDPGSVIAGVFTKSATRSANVLDCQEKIRLSDENGAAILVNSGNSNAFTGRAGDDSVRAICAAVAEVSGLPATRVFTGATGVIGERLPHDRITAAVRGLHDNLDETGLPDAARAINYYERIDWVDPAVADHLRSFLSGFGNIDRNKIDRPGTDHLTREHHIHSLKYIMKLNGATATSVILDRWDTFAPDSNGV